MSFKAFLSNLQSKLVGNNNLTSTIHTYLKTIHLFPFSLKIWLPSKDSNKIIHVATNKVQFTKLALLQWLHLLVHVPQLILHTNIWLHGHFSPNGIQQLALLYWCHSFFAGIMVHNFIKNQANEFALVANTIYAVPGVHNSAIMKQAMQMAQNAVIPNLLSFLALAVTSKYEPITFSLELYNIFSKDTCSVLRNALLTYQIWNYGVTIGPAWLICNNGVYASYVAIWIMGGKLRKEFRSLSKGSLECLRKSIKEYSHLQLCVGLANQCFSKGMALPFNAMFMFLGVMMGAMILNPAFRGISSVTALGACIYGVVVLYFTLVLGYYFPGRANHISKSVRNLWHLKLSECKSGSGMERKVDRKELKYLRSVVRSKRQLKIYIGEVNFYERGTSLQLVDFMVDKTIAALLLN